MTIKTDQEESKLRVAVRSRDLPVVQVALAEGCDANELDAHGWTVLHEAVSSGSSSITLALLRKGANPDVQEHLNRNTPLHVAAKKGHMKIVQILLDTNAKLDLRNTDGKIPEDLATSACKEFFQKKRIALLMRGGTKSYPDSSLHKMYPKRSSSPKRQHQEHHLTGRTTHGSSNTMSSLNYGENVQTGPGKVQLLVEYDKINTWLKINIQEIKDLKLPTVHNYTHIYVKCYLIPDKNKETKGKTKLIKIETSSEDGYSSRGSSASSQSSTFSLKSTDSDASQISDKVKSVLKKRPHLHSKRNKEEVKCVLHADESDSFGRISASVNEGVWYNAIVLRKYNNIMSEVKIHLSVCGRNRFTSHCIVIADVIIPLPVALKKAGIVQAYQLDYKIAVPESVGQSKMNQSWEVKDGHHYTGRSLAWNNGEASESTEAQMFQSPSVPDVSTKKHRRHQSRMSKFLKSDMNLFKGKQNDRYKKNFEMAASQEYIDTLVENPKRSVVERVGQDEVEYIGRGAEHWNDNIFEIRKELEVSAPSQPSLKYSRAFGESAKPSVRSSFYNDGICLEDM